MTTFIIFLYITGWLVCLLVAFFFLIEGNPKPAARWFLAAWLWPIVAVYIVIRYGRRFVSNVFETAELHEFVIQEQDLWQGADTPPVGKEKR